MKPIIKHLALLVTVCFAIWACTKEVETIISIDYEINEDFEGEGFVNSSLPTTVNIVPIQVLEGFDYFVKYEVVSGNGFYSSGSGIIAPNEFMPLTGLNFTGNYIPETSGEHKVKFTIRDEVGLEESTTLTYSISNLDLNWVATTNASEAGIGQEFPITLTLANNTEGSTATFTRTIRLTSGTATVSNSDGAVALNSKAGITPGTYNFTALASETGPLTIEFELEDNSGQTKTTRISITITEEPVNQSPTAVATSNVTTGTAPLTVQFDGSESTDPEEGTLTYSWNLTNESGTFNETLNGINPSYVFTTPGTYTTTLTVTDNDEATGTDTIEITVSESDNTAPTASASSDVVSGPAPLTVNFDGSGSMDSDGTIDSYSWELSNGDTFSGISPEEYTFDTPGDYTATLTVTDNDGATGTDTIEITVSEPANVAPTASASADVVSGPAPLTVNFDGSGSMDSDGTIASYSWELNNGVTFSGMSPEEYTFDTPGEYTTTLTVTDNDGETAIDIVDITVSEPEPENEGPVAVASVGSIRAQRVEFSSAETSEDWGDLTYEWDFGDGNTSIQANPTHAYKGNLRDYDVTLTVTDKQGNSDEDIINVDITNYTHLDIVTGVYTAPPGSTLTLDVEVWGYGAWQMLTLSAGESDMYTLEFFAPDEEAFDTFFARMPSDSYNLNFSVIYENPDNTSGGGSVTIIHESSREEQIITFNQDQNFPRQ